MNQPNQKSQILEQLTIHLKTDEIKPFWDIIASDGYEQTPEGVKKFILDFEDELENDSNEEKEEQLESPKFSEKINTWIKDNPEKVENLKKNGAELTSTVLKIIRGLR